MRYAFLCIPIVLFAATATIVKDVQDKLAHGDFPGAERAVQKERADHGITPETLEAMSWLGRAALSLRTLEKADSYSKEILQLAPAQFKSKSVDSNPHFATAIGAAVEVEAQLMAQRGQRAQGVAFLRKELAKYRNTSIEPRIQKNINLLALEGRPAPALAAAEYLGPKPRTLASLRGKPVLLFFWAHWCADCKADEAVIAKIRSEYASKGLVVIAPTQRYGYAAAGEDATPAQELKYIDAVRHRYYGDLLDIPAPISDQNFKSYGASTTPTIVLIGKDGMVRMYHPGQITYPELNAAVQKAMAG